MKFEVNPWNNFCRVFELPDTFPDEFCFNGGIPVTIKMVDWFNPVPGIRLIELSKFEYIQRFGMGFNSEEITEDKLYNDLAQFIRGKIYYNRERSYLIIFDFGASIIIEPNLTN